MDEESGETARLNEQHSGDLGAALSNGPGMASLVLGILAFVIQLLAWGIGSFGRINRRLRWIASLLGWIIRCSHPVSRGSRSCPQSPWPRASARSCSGLRGRKLAKAEAPGRITATIGLVLGIVCVAIPILALLAFIAWIGCCAENI
jgi:hypothetical protein